MPVALLSIKRAHGDGEHGDTFVTQCCLVSLLPRGTALRGVSHLGGTCPGMSPHWHGWDAWHRRQALLTAWQHSWLSVLLLAGLS